MLLASSTTTGYFFNFRGLTGGSSGITDQIFGDWVARTADDAGSIIHTEITDGLVVGWTTSSGYRAIQINTPVGTERTHLQHQINNGHLTGPIFCPVKKGDTWNATGSSLGAWGTGYELYFLPVSFTGNASGTIVQMVNVMDGTTAAGATVFPLTTSVPTNTDGDEYMSLAITPTSATNNLRIDVVVNLTNNINYQNMSAALYQDTTVNCLSAAWEGKGGSVTASQIVFTHFMVAGTASLTTFKVRAGAAGGTTTFNGGGAGGTAYYGGAFASSITITEIAA